MVFYIIYGLLRKKTSLFFDVLWDLCWGGWVGVLVLLLFCFFVFGVFYVVIGFFFFIVSEF